MTHDPGKEDLAEKQLSQLYQTLDAPEASCETDEAILAFARQRTMTPDEEPNKPVINWKGGFSVAASIVLVSVLYWAQLTPENFSATDSSDLDLPDFTTEQDVVATPQDMASGLGLQEQKRMVTAARVAPSATAMATDSLSVDSLSSDYLSSDSMSVDISDSLSEEVVVASTVEASAMIAGEHSRESQFAKEQLEEEQIEAIQVTGSRIATALEEQKDDPSAGSTDIEVLAETDSSIPDAHIGSAQRPSLENQLFNKLNGQFTDPKNTSSSVLPDCNVSLHGSYKLASTPLAKYTKSWNDNDKYWLIDRLNNEMEFTKVLQSSSDSLSQKRLSQKSLSAESRAMLRKPGFSENYVVVVRKLRECRVSFEPAIQ